MVVIFMTEFCFKTMYKIACDTRVVGRISNNDEIDEGRR